jgi:hypothetical protein
MLISVFRKLELDEPAAAVVESDIQAFCVTFYSLNAISSKTWMYPPPVVLAK